MELAPLLSYVELLNKWTFEDPAISIRDFSEDEITLMVGMEAVAEADRVAYAERMAASLLNLLLNVPDDAENVAKVWRCLERACVWE
jgi:hypothetical protein